MPASQGIFYALMAAVLFGASTPMAKWLLGEGTDLWLLAGLLYFSSGLGLLLLTLILRLAGASALETTLTFSDAPWLAGATLMGGVVAPVLLMVGLAGTEASTASLLLNIESLATLLIAWIVFRENVDGRIALGAAAILTGAISLSWQGGLSGVNWSALAIAGACIAWAVDNNLTRKIAGGDPVQIAMIKGIVAGSINLLLAFTHGAALPSVAVLAAAGMIGFLGYGVSLVLFVLALRHLGTARTGAYFATAPFIGILLAIIVLSEPVSTRLVVAALLMGFGLWLHLTEKHEHSHGHLANDHEHMHSHDLHHDHDHGPTDPPGKRHAHRHVHKPMLHAHPHYPDTDHWHRH